MGNVQEYKCPCCGGAIHFDSTIQKMKCPFCDTEFEMEALQGYDEALNQGECHYDFVEVMACPGGCINGGGQPIRPSFQNKPKDCADRDQCLRAYDVNSAIRFSHENQAVQTLYDEYLEAPLSDRAHHLLHVEEY